MAETPPVPPSGKAGLKAAQEQIAARYPAFKGLVNGNAEDLAKLVAEFGQDLVSLLQDLIADGGRKPTLKKYDLTTNAGLTAWENKVFSTAYFVNTEKTQETFDLQDQVEKDKQIEEAMKTIASDYGDLQLDQTQLKNLAVKSLQKGFKQGSLSLDHLVYQQAGSTTTGKEKVLAGTASSQLMKIAKSYNYMPEDLNQTISNILSGTPGVDGTVMTTESFTQAAKAQAIGAFGHLRPQIEAGSTLADIFGGYKDLISRTLEVDPSSVNVNNSLYSRFLGTEKTGQMSLGDAETIMKQDERYKFQNTKQANRDVQGIAAMLGRMFGEVK